MESSGDQATGSDFIAFNNSNQQYQEPQQHYNSYNRNFNHRGQPNFRYNNFRGRNRGFNGNYRGFQRGHRGFQPRHFNPGYQPSHQSHQSGHQQKEMPIQTYFHPSMIEDPWRQCNDYEGDVGIKKAYGKKQRPNSNLTMVEIEPSAEQPLEETDANELNENVVNST